MVALENPCQALSPAPLFRNKPVRMAAQPIQRRSLRFRNARLSSRTKPANTFYKTPECTQPSVKALSEVWRRRQRRGQERFTQRVVVEHVADQLASRVRTEPTLCSTRVGARPPAGCNSASRSATCRQDSGCWSCGGYRCPSAIRARVVLLYAPASNAYLGVVSAVTGGHHPISYPRALSAVGVATVHGRLGDADAQ